MKITALAMAILLAAVTGTAVAGVTPNNATSTLQRSGAKIAPVKNDTESHDHGSADSQPEQAK